MLFWRTIKFLGSVGILFSQNTCGGFASCWIIVRNIYSRPTNSALIKASHAINKSLRLLAFFCAPVFRVNSPSCLHLIFFPSKMHFIKWHIYLPKETELWKKILWECPKPKTTTISKGHRIRFFAPLPQKNPLIEPKIHYMSLLAVPLTSSAFLQGTTFTTDEKIWKVGKVVSRCVNT